MKSLISLFRAFIRGITPNIGIPLLTLVSAPALTVSEPTVCGVMYLLT